MIVTIDGPCGVGKSSLSHDLAQRLGFGQIDSGALYRALTLHCLEQECDFDDPAAITVACDAADVELQLDEEGEQRVLLNGRDVTGEIRTPEIGRRISNVADQRSVREKVNEVQRQMAAGANWVLDGRDTGTVVFPDAEVKIYLTADEKVRAERRLNQLRQQGRSDDELVFDRVLQELRERDARDKARPFGALEVPKGAIILDSSELNYKATLGELERHVKESSAWKTTGNAASPSS